MPLVCLAEGAGTRSSERVQRGDPSCHLRLNSSSGPTSTLVRPAHEQRTHAPQSIKRLLLSASVQQKQQFPPKHPYKHDFESICTPTHFLMHVAVQRLLMVLHLAGSKLN